MIQADGLPAYDATMVTQGVAFARYYEAARDAGAPAKAVANWLMHARRDADIERLRAGYLLRRDAMQAALRQYFGDLASWHKPEGGLFFWLKLHAHRADRQLLDVAMARGVSFMPGASFFAQTQPPQNCMRLNYSLASEAQMDRGLALLAQCIKGA